MSDVYEESKEIKMFKAWLRFVGYLILATCSGCTEPENIDVFEEPYYGNRQACDDAHECNVGGCMFIGPGEPSWICAHSRSACEVLPVGCRYDPSCIVLTCGVEVYPQLSWLDASDANLTCEAVRTGSWRQVTWECHESNWD